MAGDWIKIEKATPRKPEVLSIAETLGINPDEAFGLCFRFWSWCDDHLTEGNARSVTKTSLDALLNRSGFSDALLKAGWLQARTGSLVIPNFDRHISQTAKKRALTSQRVAAHKAKKGNAESVTEALPKEEKRRDIIERDVYSAGAKRPTLAQAKSAASQIGVSAEIADEWWHVREASEWMKGTAGGGTTAVGSNWQADLKTYASRMSAANNNGRQNQTRLVSSRLNDPEDIP